MKDKQVIFIDKKICLICTHLVGVELGKKKKACTAKNGNTKCPAQFYRVEVGIDTDAVLADFYTALQSGNIDGIISTLTDAKSNPKISDTLMQDLQDRLFESVVTEDLIGELNDFTDEDPEKVEEEEYDEDEDVDA